MEKYEALKPAWESLSDEVIEKITAVAKQADGLAERDVPDTVLSLNVFLNHQNIIGSMVRLKCDEVLLSEEHLSEAGMLLYPVYEEDLLTRRTFEGRFDGVDVYPSFNGSGRQLVYKINIEEDDRNFIVVAPQLDARLEVESTNTAVDIEESFVRLFEVDDTPYLKAVRKLERVYYDTTIDEALRLREIGTYAAKMIRRPVHYVTAEHAQALHAILNSLFDESDYFVSGYAAEDTVNEETADSVLTVDRRKTKVKGCIEELVYISDFNVEIGTDGEINITQEDDLQPAIQVVVDDGSTLIYPLRQLYRIEKAYTAPNCQEFNTKMRASYE